MAPASVTGGVAYRVRQGDWVNAEAFWLGPSGVAFNLGGTVRIIADDGQTVELSLNETPVSGPGQPINAYSTSACPRDGWIVAVNVYANPIGVILDGALYVQVYIGSGPTQNFYQVKEFVAQGYLGNGGYQTLQLGVREPMDYKATWVFQGTVAEDATVGAHQVSLIITPGTGNSMMLLGGLITVGNTATAQGAWAYVDDGSHNIAFLLNPNFSTDTVQSLNYAIPNPSTLESNLIVSANSSAQGYVPLVISGSMRLILVVQTAAFSVTQTFAVVCRLKAFSLPAAVLSDNVGTPTLTTNTNKVF